MTTRARKRALTQYGVFPATLAAASVCRGGHRYMIYVLTAIGLSPGGSTHLHTSTT
jgi:hypothetical protein